MIQDSTVADLDKLLAQARGTHARFEPEWFLNQAYYQGNQWLHWNRTRLERPPANSKRVMLVDNRIIGAVNHEVARMTRQRPNWTIVPTSGQDDDINAAQLGEKLLEYLWSKQHMSLKLRRALLWSRTCSAGFWKVFWDSTKGDSVQIVVDNSGVPVMGPNNAPVKPQQYPGPGLPDGYSAQTICTGDIHIEVRSPFQIFPDPLAETLVDCEWLIDEAVHSTEYIKLRYNFDATPDSDTAAGPVESRLFGSVGSGSSIYRGVKVKEYWAKPSTQHPNGRYACWCKGKMLDEGDNPYGRIPYVMFSGIPVAGRFWPTSIVEQLRGPQTELNKIKSQIVENANRLGNPSVAISRQSQTQITGVPGEMILFDDTTPNSLPQYLSPPGLPAYITDMLDRLEQSIQEISGQHEVSSGMVPPGVQSAAAINLLQEADDTRLGPAVTEMEETLGTAGEMVLELVARYYSDQRLIVLGGPDNAWNATPFRGSMLLGNTSVEVQAGSMFPQSKAGRQAQIQDMLNLRMQYGQLPLDQVAVRKVMHDFGMGGSERLWGDVAEDQAQVNRENGEMSLGIPLDINTFDNDQAHIDGHTGFQKSASYGRLPPATRNNIELHVQAHRERLLQAMAPQQPLPGMAAPGQPAGTPPNGVVQSPTG